ncbi:MAG TPA: ATP-binding cassette domain-containing protein, partial [Acidimicrobiia bacterium]
MESAVTEGLEAVFTIERADGFRLALSLSIAPGKTVALLGPNGAGKTTAVGALAGLLPIDAGQISLNAMVLDDPAAGVFVPASDRRVGVVFQDYHLFPHLTVRDNIGFGLQSRGAGRGRSRSRADEWLERFGLSGVGHRRPGELSGGQAQRVA